MFGKEKKEPQPIAAPPSVLPKASPAPTAKIETVIGPNAHLRGDLVSDGNVRIDGIFEGNIETTGNLVITESARVIAQVRANNMSISGAIKGDIFANRVEILETGRVWGDPTVNSLLLNEGAYLHGQVKMHGDFEPPKIEPPKSQLIAAKARVVEGNSTPVEETN